MVHSSFVTRCTVGFKALAASVTAMVKYHK